MNKRWSIHTMEYHSIVKKERTIVTATAWMMSRLLCSWKKASCIRSHTVWFHVHTSPGVSQGSGNGGDRGHYTGAWRGVLQVIEQFCISICNTNLHMWYNAWTPDTQTQTASKTGGIWMKSVYCIRASFLGFFFFNFFSDVMNLAVSGLRLFTASCRSSRGARTLQLWHTGSGLRGLSSCGTSA